MTKIGNIVIVLTDIDDSLIVMEHIVSITLCQYVEKTETFEKLNIIKIINIEDIVNSNT